MYYLITLVKITVSNHKNIIWDTFKNVDKASRIFFHCFLITFLAEMYFLKVNQQQNKVPSNLRHLWTKRLCFFPCCFK